MFIIRKYFVFIGLMCVSQLYAQDSLSLAEAINVCLQNNYNIQVEKLNVEIAKNNNTWSQAGRYPTVSLIIGQNNSIINRKPTNPFQLSGTNTASNLSPQLDVGWVLFNGFRVSMEKNRLAELEKLSLGNAHLVIENTIQSVILSYNLAVLELQRVELRSKVMRLSKERLEFVKLKREVGSAILFDVLQEQNAYLTDSSNYLNEQLNFKNALRNLNRVLNDSLEKTYLLTDSLRPINEEYTFEDLSSRMAGNNTNIRNQYTNQSLLRYNTQLTQANLYPSITANGGFTSSNDRLNAQFDRNAPGEYSTNYGNSYGGYLNFTLRYNIYNGGQLKRNIENAQIEERIGTLTIRDLEQSLRNDLLQLNDLYSLRRNLVSLADSNSRAAELNVSLAQDRYKNGFLSAIDYRIIQQTYLTTALAHLEAIYSVIETYSDLLRITGGITSAYQGEVK